VESEESTDVDLSDSDLSTALLRFDGDEQSSASCADCLSRGISARVCGLRRPEDFCACSAVTLFVMAELDNDCARFIVPAVGEVIGGSTNGGGTTVDSSEGAALSRTASLARARPADMAERGRSLLGKKESLLAPVAVAAFVGCLM
jgi:hypothetical protein